MSILNILFISMGVAITLILFLVFIMNMTRNFFTKSRYIRVLTFLEDKTLLVKHYKKKNFNLDHDYIINPNHIFINKGYTTLIFTIQSKENINPLDFQSKYEARVYTSAIKSNLIEQAFNSMKSSKLDMLKISIIVSMLTLALVAYLILKYTGVM